MSSSFSAASTGSQQAGESAEINPAPVAIVCDPPLVVSAQLADVPLCQVLAVG